MAFKYLEDKKIFIIETDNTAYSFGYHKDGHCKFLYFGEKLYDFKDYPDLSEYTDRSWWLWDEEHSLRGGANFNEPLLKISFENNERDIFTEYKSHSIKENTLSVVTEDRAHKTEITFIYKVFPECDIISKSVKVKNYSDNTIIIEDLKSGIFFIPVKNDPLKFTYFSGLWAHETVKSSEFLSDGKKILESRTGQTSVYFNPFFTADPGNTTEDYGEVWFGALAWSGNWKITLHKQKYEMFSVSAGMNDFDSEFVLNPGEEIISPEFFIGYSSSGYEKVTHNLHDLQKKYFLKSYKAIRPVLYNSWEATYFDVNYENQSKLAEIASEIGAEIFVTDDGWFGKRNSDRSGLGDWYVNPDKFPEGLTPLINKVKSLGMEFGLWVEPEMVNPDSELYKNHPDWIYRFSGNEPTLWRNQYILNIAKPEVKKYIIDFMEKLLSENDIRYIKWDMNRPILESGNNYGGINTKSVWKDHVDSLYEIWEYLTEKYKNVFFESCSGGGGRADLGILKYADHFWTSDNTDPFDRQFIQNGFSEIYQTKTMYCWVTDWNGRDTYPLSYRFAVSMMGSLGIGMDLFKLSDDEKEISKKYISLYKSIRDVVQNGKLYRIKDPNYDAYTVNEYLYADKIVIIGVRNHKKMSSFEIPHIKLRGLEDNSFYYIEDYNITLSGKALMARGINIPLKKPFDSAVIKIKKV